MDTLPWGHLQYSKYLHSLFKIMISLEPNVCLVSRDLSKKIHIFFFLQVPNLLGVPK